MSVFVDRVETIGVLEGFFTAARTPTIRARIIALVSIILAPLFVLIGWLSWSYAVAQQRDIELRRDDVARNVVLIADRKIAGVQGALLGLATSEDLVRGDFNEFKKHARAVATQPNFIAMRVLRENGQDALSIIAQNGTKDLPPLDAVSLARVFSGESMVSGIIGAESGAPFYYVAVPVQRSGRVAYALAAAIDPRGLSGVFAEAGVRPEWIAAIVDSEGRFVARSLKPDEFIGRDARPELREAASNSETSGEFDNVTFEGVAARNSFSKSTNAPWTGVVAVPQQILMAPMRTTIAVVSLGGALGALLIAGIASILASRISGPVRSLSTDALALVEGRPLPEVNYRIAELDEVRSALEVAMSKGSHLAAIIASSVDAIISIDLDGRVQSWNSGAEGLLQFTADEIVGQPVTLIVPEAGQPALAEQAELVRGGQGARLETQCLRKNGTLVDVALNLAPIRGTGGRIVAISSIAHDITERRAAEAHQHFLMRELTHRSKNLLAIVQSMASQTARSADSLEDFRNRFTQRLRGLAASHDLLVTENWSGASLARLVREQIDNFIENADSALRISGPEVFVSTRAAQAIGLALHELATNSIKYGALSVPTGEVRVSWLLKSAEPDDGAGQQLQLTWEEHGGPPVRPPKRTGFGTFVIEKMAAQSVEGHVELDYKPGGLFWSLTMPDIHLVTTDPPARGYTFEIAVRTGRPANKSH